MKKWIGACLTILLLVTVVACSKTKDEIKSDGSLKGRWELRSVQGSMPTITYAAGNGQLISFTDSTYERSGNHLNILPSGRYDIMPVIGVADSVGLAIKEGEFTHRLIVYDNTAQELYFQVNGNRLIILSGYFPLDSGVKREYELVANQ